MYTRPAGLAAGTTTLASTGVSIGWALMLSMLLVALGGVLLRLVPRHQE